MLKPAIVALSALTSLPTLAAWQLDENDSRLHFLSTKNAQITEVHRFDSLSGAITDSGELTVSVALASVDTGIEIRDTRMQEKLFETGTYGEAKFTASLPADVLAMKAGDTGIYTIEGSIDLHDENVATSFMVQATRVNDSQYTVTTVAPTLLKAGDFGLTQGLNTLQKIAGLDSITMTVPVSFSVTFTQQ